MKRSEQSGMWVLQPTIILPACSAGNAGSPHDLQLSSDYLASLFVGRLGRSLTAGWSAKGISTLLPRGRCIVLSIFIILSMAEFQAPATAATFCVNTRNALNSALTTAASNGEDDLIQVVRGTYTANFIYDSAEAFDLTIAGGYSLGCSSRVIDASTTILDAMGFGSALALQSTQSSNFVVDGFTLKNGSATGGGGLRIITAGDLTLSNNIINGNTSLTRGGGILVIATNVTMTNNNIDGNSARFEGGGVNIFATEASLTSNSINDNSGGSLRGGGIRVDVSNITLEGNIINDNSAGEGGGAFLAVSNFTLTNNTVNRNTAFSGVGGGIAFGQRTVNRGIMVANTISDNSGRSEGGGIHLQSASTFALINTIIANNTASSLGGGIFAHSTNTSLINNTIVDNALTGTGFSRGGGVEFVAFGGVADIYNNIMWNNSAQMGADIAIDNGTFSPIVNFFNNNFDHATGGIFISVPFSIDSSNLDSLDPQFVDAPNRNYHLQVGSPVIDKGDRFVPSLPATDRDGNPRVSGGIVDVGAFESQSSGLPPSLPAAGIVNAASYQSPGAVTPGALISLFGTDLAAAVQLAGTVPLPAILGGASVTIGGVPARLFFVSPSQVNLQVPWALAGMSNPALTVQTSASSPPVTLTVLNSQPGIFTTNQSGSGQGAILIANTTSLAAPLGAFPGSRPVQRGEFIEIFCTGLGPVNNPPATGAATPDASSTLVFPPTVTISGVEAPVSFAGLAPGYVALYQANVQVPQSAPVGEAVPLVLFAGANANTVTLAVK